jgi:MFS family permease
MTEQRGTPSARRWSVVAIAGAMGAYGLTLGLTYPLLSLILESQGYSSSMIGLNSAATFLGVLTSAPIILRLVRRFGPSDVMMGSIVLTIALLISLPAFPNIWAWFGLRFFLGMSINVLFVVSDAWILQAAEPKRRGRILGFYTSVIAAGFALGPALVSITGIEGWTPFVTAALIMGVAVAPPMYLARGAAPDLGSGRPAPLFAMMRAAPTLMAAAFLIAFFETGSTALFPVFGVRLGFGIGIAALMVAVLASGEMAFQIPMGILSDHFQRFRIMMICAVIGFFGAIVLPLTIEIPMLFWPLLFLWAGFIMSIYTVTLSLVGEQFSGTELISANSAISIMYGAGGAAGPTLAGVAMDAFGPNGLPWTMAVLCGGFAILIAIRHREVF